MKRFYTLMLAFASCVFLHVAGQNQTLTLVAGANINSNCNGYIEILPQGYNPNSQTTYPTIIFFMGINSTGPGTTQSLQAMITGTPANPPSQPNPDPHNGFPQDQVAAGIFPNTISGEKFIIIVPQFIINYNTRPPTPLEVNQVIDWMVANYKVDQRRLYLTGNSSGGGPVFDYPAANSTYANRVAAIVPFCGVEFSSKEKADVIRNAHVAVWAFHNDFDGGVPSSFTKEFIALINDPGPATPQVKQTIFPQSGHDCWYDAYMRLYSEAGMNIYQWMLQFQRPVTKANAGDDLNITLPNNSTQLSGSGTGPNGGVTSINWQLISGPGGSTLTGANTLTPTVGNLVYGAPYVYRLSITDGGGTATDDVVVTVYPTRIQAETPSSSSGITSNPAVDEGGGLSMQNWIAPGAFGEYNINPASSGTYVLRFRVSAFYQTPALVVKSGGNTLATMPVYWTGSWDNYITMARNVTLPAGPQTIRIESTPTGQDFNLNWMQLLAVAAAGPLPVKFSLLNASCNNGKIKLNWKTSLEENLQSFVVEKSSDGRTWKELDIVKPLGINGGDDQSYSYIDNEQGGGQYRIVGIDLDGRKTYSNVIKGSCSDSYAFNVFPNPLIDEAQISINLPKTTKVKLIMIDIRGAIVLQQEKNLLQGSNLISLNVASLPAGSYTLTASWDNDIKSVKLIKQ